MPNPKLNKLYQLYKDNQPELLGGMDEKSFVTKFSDNEKLGKLFDITNEHDAEILGGLQRDQYIAKFGENGATKYFTNQLKDMQNQASTEPRVGVSSPKALGNVTQEEALAEKPIQVAQESTANKPILDPNIGKNPFELVDLKDKDPLQEGVKNIRNFEERKREGDKANPERTAYNLGMEAINNSYNQANSNIDKVKLYVNNQKGKEDAFDDYMADLQAVSNSINSDPDKKNPNTNKLIDQFNKEWGDIQNSEMVEKYLFPSLEFLGKMQDSRNKVKDSVPNYSKYLDEIQKEQAESDKIDYTTGGGFLKGAANKLKRVIGGTFLGNIAAIGKGLTDSQVFYDIGEYAKQTEELNPSATRHQRSTVEDYVHDEETGLDMVFDDSVNGQTPQFQYFVDPNTGNMANVIMTDAIQKKIDQYAKDKKFESRRVGGAIVSQGVDELIEELPELALTVATDGLLSAGIKGLRAAKITSQSNKILSTAKTLANTKIAKDITAKHVGAHVGELLSGTIEGSADYREEGLKAGLSEDEVSAFQLAAGLNAGISDAINPMEVMALRKDIDIFFKKKLADYAAGKITKIDLLKETGASFILNTSKNLAKETVSEGIIEPLVGNKIRKTFNELKGTDFKETDINPRSIEAGFWLSAVSSGAFSVPTSMRVSKGGLMADAIKYAINNPEELQAYFKGRRAAQGGQALDRENYLKSVIDQVSDAGLSKPDKEQAALLMIDRQNASLEVEELEKKYGTDAPLVKKKRSELFDIEGKIDDIFSKEKAPQQEAQAEPEAPPPPPQAEEEAPAEEAKAPEETPPAKEEPAAAEPQAPTGTDIEKTTSDIGGSKSVSQNLTNTIGNLSRTESGLSQSERNKNLELYSSVQNADTIEDANKQISEAYHQAKQDGSNPELVKAVESELQSKEPGSTKEVIPSGKVTDKETKVTIDGENIEFTRNDTKAKVVYSGDTMSESLPSWAKKEAYLDNIENKGKKGDGRLVIEDIKSKAKELGADILTLKVENGIGFKGTKNNKLYDYYKELGFKDMNPSDPNGAMYFDLRENFTKNEKTPVIAEKVKQEKKPESQTDKIANIPFDKRTDKEHAGYVKQKFVDQFTAKGTSKAQINAALANMEERAKREYPDNPDAFYRKIQDIVGGKKVEPQAPSSPEQEKSIQNEQEAEKPRNTATIVAEGEAVIAEAEVIGKAEAAPTQEEDQKIVQTVAKIERLVNEIDSKVGKLTESYSTEGIAADYPSSVIGKKAKKEINKYAKEIAKLTGWTIPAKNGVYDNIAPAGGEVAMHFDVPGTDLQIYATVKYDPDYTDHYDDYKFDGFFYRVENPKLKGAKQFIGPNRWERQNKTAKEFADILKNEAEPYIKNALEQKKEYSALMDLREKASRLQKGNNTKELHGLHKEYIQGKESEGKTIDNLVTKSIVDIKSPAGLKLSGLDFAIPDEGMWFVDTMEIDGEEVDVYAHSPKRGEDNWVIRRPNKAEQDFWEIKNKEQYPNQFPQMLQDILDFNDKYSKDAFAKIEDGLLANNNGANKTILAPINKAIEKGDKKSEVDKAIDEIWDYFGRSGIAATPEQQAKDLEMGIKLVGLYLKKGYYKLEDIVNAGVEKLGVDKMNSLLQYIKNGYLAYQSDATDEEIDKMDDTKTVRNFTIKTESDEKRQEPVTEPETKPAIEEKPESRPITEPDTEPVIEKETSGAKPESDKTGTEPGAKLGGKKLDKTPKRQLPDLFSGITEGGDTDSDRDQNAGGIRRKPSGVEGAGVSTGGSRGSGDGDVVSTGIDRENFIPAEDKPGEIVLLGHPEENFVVNETTIPTTFNQRSRFTANLDALKLLTSLRKEKRHATKAEQEILSRYVGWGGLKVVLNPIAGTWTKADEELRPLVNELHEVISDLENTGLKGVLQSIKRSVLSAFYTPLGVIKGMYTAIEQLGFTGGHILDPSAGIGHFTGAMPGSIRGESKLTHVELDVLTGEILKNLYPNSNTEVTGLENAKIPKNYFDLIISNIPFGDISVYDKSFSTPELSGFTNKIHNYFFAKAIQQAKEGGLIAFVTSTGVMDSPSNKQIRQYINNNAEFIGAIRLPESTFQGNANTQVVSDIIFLRKKSNPDNTQAFLNETQIEVEHKAKGDRKFINVNEYFVNNPNHVIGEFKAGGQYRDNEMTVVAPKNVDLQREIERIVKNNFPIGIYSQEKQTTEIEDEAEEGVTDQFKAAKKSEIYIESDGKAYVKIDDYSEKVALPKSYPLTKVNAFIELREALKNQYQLEGEGVATESEIETSRRRLNDSYNRFISKHGLLHKKDNQPLLNKDINGFNILSLEKDKTGTKADIFSKRVIQGKRHLISAANIDDAISISINDHGYVNMQRIGSLLNQDPTKIVEDNYGILFYDTDGAVVTRSEYLSGNVKKKLSEAIELAKENPIYEANIKELRNVIPEDIPASDIEVNAGARWVMTKYYEQFASEIFKTPVNVHYSAAGDKYTIKANSHTVEITNEHGVYRTTGDKRIAYNGLELLEAAMHNVVPVVRYMVSKDPDKYETDKEATANAQEKQDRLKEMFGEWIWRDEKRRTELGRIYNDLFNTTIKRSHDGSKLTFDGLNNVTLRPHQLDAIMMLINNKGGIIDHIVGAGKAQPLDAKVLTNTGWKMMGDISIGDTVISVDGKPTEVLGVFPQGEKDIYKVSFSDGSSTECCKEHLWLTHNYKERTLATQAKNKGKKWECATPKIRTLEEISETLISPHLGAKNHSIPVVSAVHFDSQEIKVDPYLMGALIGDGHLKSCVSFTTADNEMVELISERLPSDIKIEKRKSAKYDYSLVLKSKQKPGKSRLPNTLHKYIKEYGLACKTEFKNIPQQYLLNTIEVRTELLRGLMDTDGYISKKGTQVEFNTSSKSLSDDFIFLVRSLGGICKIRSKIPTYTHKGEKKNGLIHYTISIKMPADINPFRLKRKADLVVAKTKYIPTRYIVGVEYVGRKEAQCISVSNASHLYVTDDFIVTHNTYVMIAAAIKMKQIGVANKPTIIGLKSTIPHLVEDAKNAFPNAKILTPTESDFSAKNRKKFLSKIQNNDWDLIIMSHEQFGTIPQDKDIQIEAINEEIDLLDQEMQDASDDGTPASKAALKGLEKRKENLEKKLKELLEAPKDQEILNFKQIGIDHLMVDESQMFKNLEYATKINRIAGLGNKTGSKRAFNMLIAARTLQKMHNGDKGVTFSSGTVISNSLVEMYLLFKYLRPDKMAELGYKTFDAWVTQFAVAKTEVEFSVSSDLKQKVRFRSFINLPELSMLYNEIADVRNDSNLELPKPKIKKTLDPDGKLVRAPELIAVKQSEYQKEWTKRIIEFSNQKHGKRDGTLIGKGPLSEKEQAAAMLLVTNISSKLSVDMRLIDPNAEDNPTGKLSAVAEKAANIFHETTPQKSTQLIFSDIGTPKTANTIENLKSYLEDELNLGTDDIEAIFGDDPEKLPQKKTVIERMKNVMEWSDEEIEDHIKASRETEGQFNVYAELKRKLVAKGVPEDQVVFIHDYKTKKAKQTLFEKVKMGEIRIVIGSTQKLGTGVNVQHKLIAAHHVDAPWNPAAMEQRNGRIIRQKNENPEVGIYNYGTELTLDAYKYQLIASKLKFINQIKQGASNARVQDEGDGDEVTSQMMVAILSGNPLILKLAKVEAVLTRLRRSKKTFTAEFQKTETLKNATEARIPIVKDEVAKREIDYKTISARGLDENGKVKPIVEFSPALGYESTKELGQIINDKKKALLNKPLGHSTLIAKVNGLELFGKPVRTETLDNRGIFAELEVKLYLKGEFNYDVTSSVDPTAQGTAIGAAINRFKDAIEHRKGDIERDEQNVIKYANLLNNKWEKQDALDEAEAEFKRINKILFDTAKENERNVDEAQAASEGSTDGKLRDNDLVYEPHDKDVFISVVPGKNIITGEDVYLARINDQLSPESYAKNVKPLINKYGGEWNRSSGNIVFYDRNNAASFKNDIENDFNVQNPQPLKFQKSQQTLYYENQLAEDEKRLADAKKKLASRRSELYKIVAEDQADLFGERKSQAIPKLFDERADTDVESKLEELKRNVAAAQAKVNKTKDNLEKSLGTIDNLLFQKTEPTTSGIINVDEITDISEFIDNFFGPIETPETHFEEVETTAAPTGEFVYTPGFNWYSDGPAFISGYQTDNPTVYDAIPKEEKIIKVRRGRSIAKNKRTIKNPKYKKALDIVPGSAEDYVKQAFIGGYKIHSDIIKKMFPKRKDPKTGEEKYATGEVKARIGLINNTTGFKTIGDLAERLWSDQTTDIGGEIYTDHDFAIAIEDVLLTHNGTLSMVEGLLETYYPEDNQEADEEIILTEQQESANEDQEIDEIWDYFKKIDQKEEKYIPTQEEIDKGEYDKDGNFILFQKTDMAPTSGESIAERIQKIKCP